MSPLLYPPVGERLSSFSAVPAGEGAAQNRWRKWDSLVWQATTTNPAIGNGSIRGWYRVDELFAEFYAEIVMGSTTTYGSGSYYLDGSPLPAGHPLGGSQILSGLNSYIDASGGVSLFGFNEIDTSGFLLQRLPNYAGSNGARVAINSVTPFTWATSDTMVIHAKLRYRVD
jgi:hypothetical protein